MVRIEDTCLRSLAEGTNQHPPSILRRPPFSSPPPPSSPSHCFRPKEQSVEKAPELVEKLVLNDGTLRDLFLPPRHIDRVSLPRGL